MGFTVEDGWSRGQDLAIGVLGPLVVMRGGVGKALPRSRKTRGLLSYLALAPRACRREDLCDLLWEGAADPRSELRWSLAKIRAVIGPWLHVSFNGVALACESLSIDAGAFRDMARGAGALSDQAITDALAMWRGSPLADVEVRGQSAYQAWLAAERDSLTGLRTSLLRAAVDRTWERPEEALEAARRLVALEPWNEWGHGRVAQLLERCGRLPEAAAYVAAMRQSLSRELGIPEAQVLLEAPPPPQVACVGSDRSRASRRALRRVVQLEPLKLLPSGDECAGLAMQVTADLGSGLWRSRSCDLLDAEGMAQSRPEGCVGADFAVRGAVVRWGKSVQLSLRCVDLRLGIVVWFGQITLGSPFSPGLSQWVEGAAEAIEAAIRTAGPGSDDSGDRLDRFLTARALAGALQPVANRQALDLLNTILAEDADEPSALAYTAWCYAQRAVYNWSSHPDRDREEARRCAAMATRIGSDDPECLTTIAAARTLVADLNGAGVLLDRAVRLAPQVLGAHVRSGWLANYLDQPVRAVRHFRMVIGLAPLDPASFNSLTGLGVAHFIRGEHTQAIRHMEQALALNPKAIWIHRNLVPAYAAAGERQKARDGILALVQDYPKLTVAAVCDAMVFSPTVMAKIAEGLHSAGLPRT